PHPNIGTIGVHQLLFAFGVGRAAKSEPFKIEYMQRCNDMNFAAVNKRNFPKLQGLLRDLEQNDGPSQLGLSRWEKWWDQLEDCTGGLLGTLPQDELGSDNGDDGEEEESDEYESEESETGGDWQEEDRPLRHGNSETYLNSVGGCPQKRIGTVSADLELLAALQIESS
ncbi:hypothetical protein BJ322DRAFT_1025767, partial [Thelephora terrestris]